MVKAYKEKEKDEFSILIKNEDTDYRIPKGNFVFLYDLDSPRKSLYELLSKTESLVLLDRVTFVKNLRGSFDSFAREEEARRLCALDGVDYEQGRNSSLYKEKVKVKVKSQTLRYRDIVIQLCSDNIKKYERVVALINDLGICNRKIRSINNYIDLLYNFGNAYAHDDEDDIEKDGFQPKLRNCLAYLRTFHMFLKIYYGADTPDYDDNLTPIDEYYPIVKDMDGHMIDEISQLNLRGEKSVYVKCIKHPFLKKPEYEYYIISRNNFYLDKAEKREIKSLLNLRESVNYTGNLIRYESNLISEPINDFSCVIERLPGFPYALDARINTLQKMSLESRINVVKGMCLGVNYLHMFGEGMMSHRNIRPDRFLIFQNGKKYDACLYKLEVVKDVDSESSRLSALLEMESSKNTNQFIAPEVLNTSADDKKDWILQWKKADVFSFAKTAAFVLSNIDFIYTDIATDKERYKDRLTDYYDKLCELDDGSKYSDVIECLIEMLSYNPEERPEMNELLEKIH